MNGWRWFVLTPLVMIAGGYLFASQPAAHSALTHVITDKKLVALTFDDGPSPKYTPIILRTLTEFHDHATFFVVGSEAQRFPSLIPEIARQGSAIANHGWNHMNLRQSGAQALWEDARKSADFIRTLGVSPVPFYRPPYGYTSQPMLALFAEHGVSVVLWSIDTRDWSRPGIGSIINKVATQVKPGAIILMHDGGGNRTQTATALTAILEQLKQMGYKVVTLPQLIKDSTGPKPSTV